MSFTESENSLQEGAVPHLKELADFVNDSKCNKKVIHDTMPLPSSAHATPPIEDLESSIKANYNIPLNPAFGIAILTKANLDLEIGKLSNNPHAFPVSALPLKIQEIVKQKHQCLNYPLDFAAASAFHACATGIGNTYRSLWGGAYEVTTTLFMTLVAEPGRNKSEPVKNAYKPIMQRDDELFKQYERECEAYEVLKHGHVEELPTKSKLKKIIVSDTTIEALALVAQNNPRGICSLVDEQAGWLKNMNRYNSGSEQELWLSIYNSNPFIIDRASRNSIRVSSYCINVLGTIQPLILSEFAKDGRNHNGMTDRFLYVKPENLTPAMWSRKKLDQTVEAEWKSVLNTLLNLEFASVDGKEVPNQIPFTAEAEDILYEWQQQDVEENLTLNNKTVDGICAKLYIYVLRFALILQLSRYACAEANKDAIDAESAKNAILLAKYFKHTANEASGIINKTSIQKLSQLQKDVYAALPNEFKTSEGNEIVERFDVPKRTFEYWLNNPKMFLKVAHGLYRKVHKN